MALNGNARENDPRPSKEQVPPARSRRSQDDDEWEELDVGGGKKGRLSGAFKKLKDPRWFKDNLYLIVGLTAGGLLLVFLVLGAQLGWFGSGQTSPAAAQPDTPGPAAPNLPPQPAAPAVPTPKAASTPQEETKKEETKTPALPPLSEDVTSWGSEDYFRARRENDPKLLLAVVYLAQKYKGSQASAAGLAKMLKPLPPEPSPDAAPAQPGAEGTIAGSAAAPSGRAHLPPGAMPQPGRMPPAVPGMDPRRSPGAAPGNQDNAKIVEAIVGALAENGSAPAWKTLEGVLAGTFVTADDRTAVEATLKTLASHPCEASDALFLRALTASEALRPKDREGPWPAKDLQAKAIELVKSSASIGLRAKLAEAMGDQLLKRVADNPLREVVLAPDPVNCGAQILLRESKEIDKEIQTRINMQLGSYSAAALAQLMKVPVENRTGGGFGGMPGAGFDRPRGGLDRVGGRAGPVGGGLGAAADSLGKADAASAAQASLEPALQIAKILWSPTFRGRVEKQLGDLRSLDRDADLILLAATMPYDSTRSALGKLIPTRWMDGPKALEKAGFPDGMLTDPGMVVILKLLRRRDNKQSRGNRAAADASDAKTLAQKKAQAEQDWLDLSCRLVSMWRKRLQDAALAQKKVEEELGNVGAEANAKLPPDITLAPGAKVIASYHLVWPAEAPTEMAGDKPSGLEVHYIYAEEANRPKKAVSYYSRQAGRRVTDARILDNSLWFDGQKVGLEGNRRRSIDVFVSRPNNPISELLRDDLEADLAIEILTIEVKDPTKD